MSHEGAITILVFAVLLVLYLRHNRHVTKYPEKLTCGTCTGGGKITDTTWLGRTVRGECPECHGDSWAPRRRNG